MSDFKTRLFDEATQLNERIEKLSSFFSSDKSKGLDDVQLTLLGIQLKAMETYSQCLTERIARL